MVRAPEKKEGWGIRILRGIWTVIVWIVKGLWWIAMKWWNYLDKIASMNPQDFENKPATQTPQVNVTSKKVETAMINGKPYYKDKQGNWRPLEV